MGDLQEMPKESYRHEHEDRLTRHRRMHEETVQEKLQSIEETAEFLRRRTTHRPQIAVICGTGLGGLADLLTDTDVIPYDQIPHFLIGSVPGHAGKLIFGNLRGKTIVCMQGRVHAYEGNAMWKTTFPIRVFAALGVKILFATNASGGLNPSYSVGDVVLLKDHINLAGLVGLNPFVGLNDERFGERFVAMSGAYDRDLRQLVRGVAAELNMDFLKEGVYVCQVGPSFETVSESRMMITLGADCAGMSTVFEVGVARHCGLRCLCLSLITNMCLVEYDSDETAASHAENLASSLTRADDLKLLVSTVIERMPLD